MVVPAGVSNRKVSPGPSSSTADITSSLLFSGFLEVTIRQDSQGRAAVRMCVLWQGYESDSTLA